MDALYFIESDRANRAEAQLTEKDREIEKLKVIIKKLEERLQFAQQMANEKQNRIDRAMTYNKYLREKCSYRLNDGHLRKMEKILLGTETELKEIPRMGVKQ